VKLGLFNMMELYDRNTSPTSIVNTTIETVRMAEDFGFDTAWFSDSQFSGNSVCPSALMMLSRCVGETRQIRLGVAALALPLCDPLRLVQELAFADVLAAGRLVIAIGSRSTSPGRFGESTTENSAISMEVWDVIGQALLTGQVEYFGDYVHIPLTQLSMRPFSLSLPEIFVAGESRDLICRASGHRATPFMSFGSRGLAEAMRIRERIAEHWTEGGGDADTMPLAIHRFIYVTDDAAEAEYVTRSVRDFKDRKFVPGGAEARASGTVLLGGQALLSGFMGDAIIGTPGYCVDRLCQEIKALKPSHLCCTVVLPGVGRARTLNSVERLGCVVLPQLSEYVELAVPRKDPRDHTALR
jgi:alkanesulfonate monooxygenase SsuD/methylene tetrahydromethanopterin reductase-like flavin-dependent oxidoreductase (luciferase family)